MQASHSPTTDLKAQKLVRKEWGSFQTWLFEQHRKLEARENEISSAALRRRGKLDRADKQLILSLRDEFLAAARASWLNRVRHGGLQIQSWLMTPDEKHALKEMLGWTQEDMIGTYSEEQSHLGMKYERVDPSTLGTKEPAGRATSPKITAERPAYTKWASEINPSAFRTKETPKPSSSKKEQPAYMKWASEAAKMSAVSPRRPQIPLASAELPALPLYYIGALLQGTDLDAVAAADLEAFAVEAGEEKIREYYSEACDASVDFQSLLPTLNASERARVQEDFDHYMQELAARKEREWKAITVKELRRCQAVEMERRLAQQRAMRPPPRSRLRRKNRRWDVDTPVWSPLRRRRRELEEEYVDDWDYIETPPRSPHRHQRRGLAAEQEYADDWGSDDTPARRSPHQHQRRGLAPEQEYADDWGYGDTPARRSPRRHQRHRLATEQMFGDDWGYDNTSRHIRPWTSPEQEYARGRVPALPENSQRRHLGTSPRTAALDWSSVLVDEMDLKLAKPAALKTRGNGLLLRLDRTKKKSELGNRENVNHHKNKKIQKKQTTPQIPTNRLHTRLGRRRRVPNEDGNIEMEREIQPMATTQKAGKTSTSLQSSYKFGRLGPVGIDVDSGHVSARPNQRRRNLKNVVKKVRFALSAANSADLQDDANRPSSKNETRSKFYEAFDSLGVSALDIA